MHQDMESHKIFKRKQLDHLTSEVHDLRDFKLSLTKKFESISQGIMQTQKVVEKELHSMDDRIDEIKGPLMREIMNSKREN